MKKKATWIVGFSYLLIIALLLFIIPLSLDRSPFYLWTDAQISANLMVLYAGALYSSILAIFIYRDFNENGTELLIFSKPISRRELTFYKFLCFITTGAIFSIFATLMGCAVFAFKNVTTDECLSLLLSLFGGNFLMIIAFGFISVIVTLFLNKIWTNLINICIVVIFMIFHMVSTFTVKTPAQYITEDPMYSLTSFRYVDQNGNPQYAGSLNSNKAFVSKNGVKAEFNGMPVAFEINNLEDVKAIYAINDKKSKTEISNIFDIVQQYDSMFNVGSLSVRKENNAYESFGNNRWYNYEVNENNIAFSNEKRPLGFVTNLNTDSWTKTLVDVQTEMSERWRMIGIKERGANNIEVFDSSDKMYVGRTYPNFAKTGTAKYWEPQELQFNDVQQKWLNDFLFDGDYTSDDFLGFLNNPNAIEPHTYYSSINEKKNKDGSIYRKYSSNPNEGSLYNYIHDLIANTKGKGIFPELDKSNSPSDFAIAILKFKYNCFITLTKMINGLCKFEKNIFSGNQPFKNYKSVLDIILGDEASQVVTKGRPLNPVDDDGEDLNDSKNYFYNDTIKNARAFLEEYVVVQENFGYTSTQMKNWNRERDRFTATFYTYESNLFTTFMNTTFTFNVKPTYSINQLWMAWGLISLALMGIAILIYYRTDFK